MQWHFSIVPRIHRFVPADTILEIGPGFGRWTQFLLKLCKNLILVDVSEKCISYCRTRFDKFQHIKYYVNDGKSLEMIGGGSIDFVFSHDSLVHAEDDVIESYLAQLAGRLKYGGAGFIHHSNMGEYKRYFSLINRIPPGKLRDLLVSMKIIEWSDQGRAHSMTASKFKEFAEKAGLDCISQEMINWNSERLIDCLSVFKKSDVKGGRACAGLRNWHFMREREMIGGLSKLYSQDALS